MAELTQRQNVVMTVSGGNFQPGASYSVIVYKRGSAVNGAQSGTLTSITVRSGALRWASGNKGMVGLSPTLLFTVNGTPSTDTAIPVTSVNLGTIATGTRLVNLGADTGSTTAAFDGSGQVIYASPIDTVTAVTNSTVTSNAQGEYEYYATTGSVVDEIIKTGSTVSDILEDVYVGAPNRIIGPDPDGASAVGVIVDTSNSFTTAGAKLLSIRNATVEKASVDKAGNIVTSGTLAVTGASTLTGAVTAATTLAVTGIATMPDIVNGRLGQSSTATTGGAIRIVDGSKFALTVAGVQAALDELETVGGGTVIVPSTAGISITSTSVKVPNRVTLMGLGPLGSTSTFVAANTASVSAMVENKTQDGTQQFAGIQGISCNGNKGGGALITAGIYLKNVYFGSNIRDCHVTACSGIGILLEGTAAANFGPMGLINVSVTLCNNHNIELLGAMSSVSLYNVTSENTAAGKSCIIVTNATAVASTGHVFNNIHFEQNAASNGLLLDGCANCTVDGIVEAGGGLALNVVKITGSVTGSDGAFASAGHVIRNCLGNLTTIIDDQVSGVTVGNAQGRFVRWYSSPVASATLDTAQIVGLQPQRVGVSITAAATITPGEGSYFVVTGNTNITSVTATARDKGRIIVLNFSGTPTFTDGSNLKLAGNLVATADDTITIVCDGTNWIEMARSIN